MTPIESTGFGFRSFADLHCVLAARMERTSSREVEGFRDISRNRVQFVSIVHLWYRFQECLRVGMPRCLKEHFDGCVFHYAACIHHYHTIAEIGHDAEIVRDQPLGRICLSSKLAEQSQ